MGTVPHAMTTPAQHILMVALGGAAGAVTRYGLSRIVELWVGTTFPFGTLVVNVLGCLAIGLVMGWVSTRTELSDAVRLLLVVGFLGSLTTFSTFGGDTITLVRDGMVPQAIGNIALNLVVGFGAVLAGFWIAR